MSCEHCDSSIPHDHDAVPDAMARAKANTKMLLMVQAAVAAVALIASVIFLPLSSWPIPFGWGLATWAAATGLGAIAGTWARGGKDISRNSVAMRVRLVAGIAAALVLVLGALVAAARSEDGRYVGGTAASGLEAWQVALAVLAGWLVGAAVAAAVQTYGWLRVVDSPGDAGELVRAGIMHSRSAGIARPLLAFLVPALMVAVWTLVFVWLPLVVLVALPAQALIAIAMTRR